MVVIRPIFKVMLVAAFMMHPGGGISVDFSFPVIGAAVALIVFASAQKFGRGVF